jgi:malonate transporter and related proteins
MQAVITIALPFFALIFTGYAAGRSRLLSSSAINGMSVFVFYFALPALLLVSVAQAPVREILDPRLLAAWLGPSIALFALTYLLAGRLFATNPSQRAIQALTAVFSNVGFVGLPLVIVAFGTAATIPAIIVVLIDTVIMIGIATAIIETHRGGGGGAARVTRAIASGVVRNPIILASAAGMLLGLYQLELPGPLAAYLQLLGSAAAPTALFALGASLAGRPMGEGLGETGILVGIKLLVHPALVFLVATLLGLPDLWTAVLVVQASLPIAANVYVLAQRYRVHVEQASTAIFVSTALAVFTVSAVLSFFVD